MVFKITDSMVGKPKAFEEIQHNHSTEPTALQMKKCERCHYDVAENSIPKKEFKQRNKTITKITIFRGSLDDCIGWLF